MYETLKFYNICFRYGIYKTGSWLHIQHVTALAILLGSALSMLWLGIPVTRRL